MEPLKTINSLQKSFVNKDLLKKRINKKNNYSNDKKKNNNNNFFQRKPWFYCIKVKFQKIINLLDTTSDDKDLPRFVTKNG